VAKDKEVPYECVYLGTHQPPAEPVEQTPVAPSANLVQMVALSVLAGVRGSYRPSVHFGRQMMERNFDVFDMEYAIRNGKCIEQGEYSAEHKNHKYVFRCAIDGVDFEAVFAISAEHDLIESPQMILITGCWKTKTGKRRNRY
jgi:hypothetical protein